jgi:predicted nucleotidyltransferase
MIPNFDENGNLPSGIHVATFNEVIERFGGSKSLKRSVLTKNLKEFYNFIKYYFVEIYIDGSYVTTKLAPNDVDIVVILPDDFRKLEIQNRRLLDFALGRRLNQLHIFTHYEGRDDVMISKRIDLFSKDRNGNRKGIICIKKES